MRTVAALAMLALCASTACAESSIGDCTDKGVCPPDDIEPTYDASARDGTDDAHGIDVTAPGRDAAHEAAEDAVSDSPSDASDAHDARDAAEDAPDSSIDSPADSAADSPTDAPADGRGSGCGSVEICGNGFDDDCNGFIDCADSACTDFACVPSAPAGWSGPLAFAEAIGAPPAPLAACAAPYGSVAYDGNADPSAAPAQCSCTCSAATGMQCPAPTVDLYSDNSCGTHCNAAQVPPSGCTAISTGPCGAAIYAKSAPPAPTGGSCTPQPSASIPASSWGRALRVCALPKTANQGGCAASAVCAPSPIAPFSGHLCVSAPGDVPCPTGSGYTVRHVAYGAVTDTRACSACTCGAPSGGSCAGTFSTHNTSSCSLFTSTFPLSSTACNSVQIATSGLKSSALVESGSSCTPSGGQAIGAATPTLPTTLCCSP